MKSLLSDLFESALEFKRSGSIKLNNTWNLDLYTKGDLVIVDPVSNLNDITIPAPTTDEMIQSILQDQNQELKVFDILKDTILSKTFIFTDRTENPGVRLARKGHDGYSYNGYFYVEISITDFDSIPNSRCLLPPGILSYEWEKGYKIIEIIEAASKDHNKSTLLVKSSIITNLQDKVAKHNTQNAPTVVFNPANAYPRADEQYPSPRNKILAFFINILHEIAKSIRDAFDRTFYVPKYAENPANLTGIDRVKAFLEWPAGKGKAGIIEYLLLLGFLLSLLKNILKLAAEFPLLLAGLLFDKFRVYLEDTIEKAYLNKEEPLWVSILYGLTDGCAFFLQHLTFILYLAVRATLSPVASYEAANNISRFAFFLAPLSIFFSGAAIIGSLLLLGPLALFIAGKIAGPLAVKTLAGYLGQLASQLGITSLVLQVATTIGVPVATVTAGIFIAATSLAVALVNKLPTIFTYLLTKCGFFGGGEVYDVNYDDPNSPFDNSNNYGTGNNPYKYGYIQTSSLKYDNHQNEQVKLTYGDNVNCCALWLTLFGVSGNNQQKGSNNHHTDYHRQELRFI